MIITLDEHDRIVELDHALNILSDRVLGPLGSVGQSLGIGADGKLAWITSAGTLTGSGVDKQLAYWTGTSSLAGNTGLVYEYNGGTPTESVLVIGAATSETGLNVKLQLINDSASLQGIGTLGYRGSGAYLVLASSRGNRGVSEAALQADDVLGSINFIGRKSASAWHSATARIQARADENFSDTVGWTRIEFAVTAVGSTTLINKMTLTSAGGLNISGNLSVSGTFGNINSTGNLDVDGTFDVNDSTPIFGAFTLTIPASGTVALGTGTATQIAFWSGANTLTSHANLVFVGATPTLTLGTGTGTPAGGSPFIINTGAPMIEYIGAPGADQYAAGVDGTGFQIYNTTSDYIVFLIDSNDNTGLASASAFGTSAVGTLAMKNGTAPSAAVADQFHLYAKDAAAGKSWPVFKAEDNTERFVLGVSGTGNNTTNARSLSGSTVTAQAGYLTLHDHTGATVYVPYFSAV